MTRFYMYGHGGSNNHGCEAIVTATMNMLGEDNEYVISSLDKYADEKFIPQGKVKEIYPDKYTNNKLLRKIYGAWRKFFNDQEIVARKTYKNFKKSLSKQPEGTIFMSVGGDNYCCHNPAWLYYSNKLIDKHGFTRVLWGCTVDGAFLDEAMICDLDGYKLITARDEMTYQVLSQKLKKAKVVRVSDPAFTVAKQDSGFKVKADTIGINISPLVTKNGSNKDVISSVENLIEHILEDKEKNILFIPHVNINGNSDYETMKPFYEKYSHTGRVQILGTDYNYAQLRDIISQCQMLICARTHASISAYSMCVPTLVIGYSIKSIGIARDLFGTEKGFVISAQSMCNKDEIVELYENIIANKDEIKEKAQEFMPEYVKNAYTASDSLKTIIK